MRDLSPTTDHFNFDDLTIEMRQLKVMSTALGGSAQFVDPSVPPIGNKYTYIREEVPFAVARAFIKANSTGRFLKPTWCAVLKYRGNIVSVENHPYSSMAVVNFDDAGNADWNPITKTMLAKLKHEVISVGSTWWFDGRYAYQYTDGEGADAIVAGQPLSADGSFKSIPVRVIDLYKVSTPAIETIVGNRVCVSFQAGDVFVISPPAWSSTNSFKCGSATEDSLMFDNMDKVKVVNLNFILNVGQSLKDLYGYQTLEPLNLPSLMIRMRTVNLNTVATPTKQQCGADMTFKQMFAWLLGLYGRGTSDQRAVIRALIKLLTSKGITDRRISEGLDVYKEGMTYEDVPHTDVSKEYKLNGGSLLSYAKRMDARARASSGLIVGD